MSKGKRNMPDLDMDAPQEQGEAVQTETVPQNGKRAKKGANVVYLLVAEVGTPVQRRIIGVKHTRGQCWKQWENIRDLAASGYDRVYAVRGSVIECESLYRNITRQRKPK